MLTAQQLLDMGFTGKRVGEILKMSKNWGEDQLNHFLSGGEVPQTHISMKTGTVWHWLSTDIFESFPSRETNGIASNSEKRRWLDNGAVLINGQAAKPDDYMSSFRPIKSLVFFPNGRRVTMW